MHQRTGGTSEVWSHYKDAYYISPRGRKYKSMIQVAAALVAESNAESERAKQTKKKKKKSPVAPPSNMKAELDPRLQGWYYNMKVDEDGQRYKSLKAPNGRRFNSLKEAIEYAVRYRSDRYCLSKANKEEGWYLNPISQRIRVLREFGKKKKNLCGTIVASLIKRDSIHFMNLHDDEGYEMLKVQELLAGKRAYEVLMNQTNAKT